MSNTSVRTIRVLHRPVANNNYTVWKFCKTSDGGYIIRKNGWYDVKTVRSWNELLFQFHKWSEFTDKNGQPMFREGYPPRAEVSAEVEPEVLDEPATVNGVDTDDVAF